MQDFFVESERMKRWYLHITQLVIKVRPMTQLVISDRVHGIDDELISKVL